MILIGQYDSPFVRRVAIAMAIYELPYEHRPWSVFANAEELARYNPLRRVPVLVLDDALELVESSAILDALDEMVDADRALVPRAGGGRREVMRVCAFATGLADKAVSLFYEGRLHAEPSSVWVGRCRIQMADTLDLLERERAARHTPWWFSDALTHADIAVACVLRFVGESHPAFWDPARWPSLAAHSARAEALPVFQTIAQPLTVAVSA